MRAALAILIASASAAQAEAEAVRIYTHDVSECAADLAGSYDGETYSPGLGRPAFEIRSTHPVNARTTLHHGRWLPDGAPEYVAFRFTEKAGLPYELRVHGGKSTRTHRVCPEGLSGSTDEGN